MKHFFYEPRKGFKKSPADFAGGLAAGTAGLAGGVVGGTGAYAFGLVSMVMGGVSNGFGALAIDPQYNARRQLAQQQHVAHSGEGLLLGMQASQLHIMQPEATPRSPSPRDAAARGALSPAPP